MLVGPHRATVRGRVLLLNSSQFRDGVCLVVDEILYYV